MKNRKESIQTNESENSSIKLSKDKTKFLNLAAENSGLSEIHSGIQKILDGQTVIDQTIKLGFIRLAKQNSELLKSNDELIKLNKKLNQKLVGVVEELNLIKKERQDKDARRKAYTNRKRLPKRDPVTPKIYKSLMKEAEGLDYIAARMRIAICILTVTGIRISELLPLKVDQLETLRKSHWIRIDRLKRGPANHKAFLTLEGKKLVKDREKDFELLFLMKDPDSYIFTSDTTHYKILRRETITIEINKLMRSVSNNFPEKPNITSHSFQVGYISRLWKDTKDIEFVKQAIGHRSMESTSSYVNKMSDKERENRMTTI